MDMCWVPQHDVLDDDTSGVNTQCVELPVLARIEAKIATRRGTCVWRLTEKATAAREPVMDFITLNPEQWKEGEYTPSITPTLSPTPEKDELESIPTHENDQIEDDTDSSTLWLEQESLGVDLWSELQG